MSRRKSDKSKKLKGYLGIFYTILLLLIIIDFFIPKHPYFRWEGFPSFYAAFAFVAFVVLVLAAKYILRKIVMRDEDYYG
ncbi:MAG: hypothetical protein IBX64_02300 [Actinobacteria bacterium]|nr:hypothetical protein [Actinomycetota bacterium]